MACGNYNAFSSRHFPPDLGKRYNFYELHGKKLKENERTTAAQAAKHKIHTTITANIKIIKR